MNIWRIWVFIIEILFIGVFGEVNLIFVFNFDVLNEIDVFLL